MLQRNCKKTGFICHFLLHDKKWRKNRAKPFPLGVPFFPPSLFLTKRRRRKYSTYKALPWVKYDDPRLLLSIKRALFHRSQRSQFFFLGICSHWLYDFSVLSKSQTFTYVEARAFLKIQVNVHSCKNAHSPTRLVYARRALSLL